MKVYLALGLVWVLFLVFVWSVYDWTAPFASLLLLVVVGAGRSLEGDEDDEDETRPLSDGLDVFLSYLLTWGAVGCMALLVYAATNAPFKEGARYA